MKPSILLAALLAVSYFFCPYDLHAAKEKNIIKFGRDIVIAERRTVRGAAAVAGNVTVQGLVEDDVVAVGGSVILGPRATVGGNVVSVGGIIDKDPAASVSGNIVEVNVPGISSFTDSVTKYRSGSYRWILRGVSFIGLLTLALLTVVIIPVPVIRISEKIEHHTLNAISWSVRGLLLIVPLAVILTMSVAGIFLIPLEVILFVGASLLGYIAVARLIGKIIILPLYASSSIMWLEMTAGITILTIIGYIPILGLVVRAVVALIGFGGVISAFMPARKGQPV